MKSIPITEYEEYLHHGKKLRGIFTKLKTNNVVQESNYSIYSILSEYGISVRSRLPGNRKHKFNINNERNI
jgi:hypothetical protein